MAPAFLLPESTAREGGQGPEFRLDAHTRQPLLLTLGINRILEQESLEVSVWGSCDGKEWRPLVAFPPKSYCGKYHLTLDLARHSDVAMLRAQWTMSRWDQDRPQPLFGFYVYAEELQLHVAGAA
ncbi:MAG: hypothetical protein EXQ47_01150 [Bryobacterales bacterium]|nr:hypothetical protein [Bryobacterales bacterium]